ncbi:hypothetical protein GH975_05300 [Litorivicinus lipolyticus]|uniref:NADH dehydrogenase subunit E n=1 Tax=Litorivicinus lipolyticus TaxID=418701 RepID=A0A5Q2QAH9_9GAMM|nr:hypothetical protein [Litorivicinus lipolyticus]QGG80024.1 hypothetical protein GH975_05300 [Litorivicinus lipolyticus]
MFKEVQTIASQSLAWSMMPLEQWAKWTDDSHRSLQALIEQSKASQDKLFKDALDEVRFFEGQAKTVWQSSETVWQQTTEVFDVAAEAPAIESPKVVVAEAPKTATKAKTKAKTKAQKLAVPVEVLEAVIEPERHSTGKDDLTRISGVGPALEKKLNAAGFTRFDQIASLSAADIENLESTVIRFTGRIERDDWKGQAASLAANAS